MTSKHIFNSDIVSGNTFWAESLQSTGNRVFVYSNLDVLKDFKVGEAAQLSGTLHVDKDAVLKSDLYLEDDLNVGKNSQLSGTLHVDKDAVLRSGLFVEGDARIDGNLYVSGDQVIMETATVRVEDKNIELAVLDSPSDITADGGGITLKGDTDKTVLWSNSTDSWDFSEHVGVADGKYIFSDKVRARDSAGLFLVDDGGNGLFVKDGGDVGIGTPSPTYKLHINAAGNNSSPALFIDAKTRSDTVDLVKIDGGVAINNSNVFTIKSDGKVGIGSVSPEFPLDIYGSNSSAALRVTDSQTWLRSNASVSTLYVDQSGSGPASIFMGGNVGIGTLSPAYRIESFGKVSNSISITSTHTDTTLIQHASMFTDAAGFGKIGLFNDVGNRLVEINSNGNSFFNGGDVGIGTESPHTKLEVRGSVSIDDDGTTKGLWFGDLAESQAKGYIGGGTFAVNNLGENDFGISSSSENDLVFGVGGTEEMRITPSGNVGIGTSSPNEKLDLNGILYLRNSTAPTTTTNRLYAVGGELFWNGEDVRNARDTIGELEDTSIGTKSNGQLLMWNATSSRWVNNTLTGGNGIDVTNAAGAITITHANTGDQASISASGRTYVRGVNLDEFGHVTSLSMGTETVTDTNTHRAISSSPTNGATITSISSDWAFDNVKTAVPANAVFTDTVPTFSYNSTTKTLTITT